MYCRDSAVQVLTDAFATVSKAGKVGPVRDALTAGFPRAAQMVEATFDRLVSETTMKVSQQLLNLLLFEILADLSLLA